MWNHQISPGGNKVLKRSELKKDQIVMCPNDCLAIHQPKNGDETIPTPQNDILPIKKEDSMMNNGL